MAVNGGRWILGPPLGHGATATVSLAVDAISGDLFAVKSSHISRAALLQKEQSILSSISSPHIISCLGSSVSRDSCNLFLEFAAGGALSDIAGYLSEPKIRSFTRQILLALCYLHSNGIVHGDVKGRNVLVGSEGKIKLGDFGCAHRVGEGLVMGTPAFMAPEVARGEEQGIASDVWSLGCTVVEMATGKSPWPDVNDAVAAIHRIGFTGDVPAMPECVLEEAKDFVLKCFQRDPKERWTAEQLLSHPFVAEIEEEENYSVLPCFSSKLEKWVSPKTTLDFALWEMGTEEDGEDEILNLKDESEMGIRQLDSPPANWTWDDDWIEVRGSIDEKEAAMSPEAECGGLISGAGCECSGRDSDFDCDGDEQEDFCSYSLNDKVEKLGSAFSVNQFEGGDVAEHLVSSCTVRNGDCNKDFRIS
ncbi:mitogen-activated protein kinase kinase kinase NPK1-like [Phalaenopsis equestris]|uniref:mitogen-activated protein kinase kinase kinase NPK1-like n=1 Tax=Phalaenopsis equestris TaxID=78828 RepID=UPI0009E5B30F|nr:mitogen-activated protein kinase kinase kinase NPK1-like [Phalaenopsis equestris]